MVNKTINKMTKQAKIELIVLSTLIIIFSSALTCCFIKLDEMYQYNKKSNTIITNVYNNPNNFHKLNKGE